MSKEERRELYLKKARWVIEGNGLEFRIICEVFTEDILNAMKQLIEAVGIDTAVGAEYRREDFDVKIRIYKLPFDVYVVQVPEADVYIVLGITRKYFCTVENNTAKCGYVVPDVLRPYLKYIRFIHEVVLDAAEDVYLSIKDYYNVGRLDVRVPEVDGSIIVEIQEEPN